MLSLGFVRSKSNHYVYCMTENDHLLIIALYVDDMLFIGNDKGMIVDLKSQLSACFEMKYLGATRYILGMEINRDIKNRKIWLSQRKYTSTVLERFNMSEHK